MRAVVVFVGAALFCRCERLLALSELALALDELLLERRQLLGPAVELLGPAVELGRGLRERGFTCVERLARLRCVDRLVACGRDGRRLAIGQLGSRGGELALAGGECCPERLELQAEALDLRLGLGVALGDPGFGQPRPNGHEPARAALECLLATGHAGKRLLQLALAHLHVRDALREGLLQSLELRGGLHPLPSQSLALGFHVGVLVLSVERAPEPAHGADRTRRA